MNFVWYILIGIAAGFIAGLITKGSGFGILINLVVGIIGSVLGGWLFGMLGMSPDSIFGSLVTATIGAVLLLWIVSALTRTTRKD